MSIRFINHTGPLSEGKEYILECTVQNVAPVQNLVVTFYKGQTVLKHDNINEQEKKPMNPSFTWIVNSTKEDNGVQYWCDAKLELEMTPSAPLVTSQNITATVYCESKKEKKYIHIK